MFNTEEIRSAMIPLRDEPMYAREEPRTKMLLGATMDYGGHSMQCHIRNLSEHGALVQCSTPPPEHATVSLRRGRLYLAGEVAWAARELFGLRLSTGVDLNEWLHCSGESGKTESPKDQKKMVTSFSPALLDHRLSEEIAYVARTIENASEVLVNDPVLRNRHSAILQQLVIGSEMLRDLSRIVKAEDRISLIADELSGPMRQRLLRDSNFESGS
jgi:hypothetical protein